MSATAANEVFPATLPAAHDLIRELRWQVAQLKKELYGPSADRAPTAEACSKEQILLSLFPAPAEPPATQDVALPETPASETARPARRRSAPPPRTLETVVERIEPDEKVCPHCGKAKCEIGCEKSERFEYIPAKIIRHEIHRPKLACPCGQGTVVIAPLPPTPVEKGHPAASLLAQVILSKYADHLPLYRQQQQFARLGVNFPRQTLADWVEQGAAWLEPIVREMKQNLLAGDYLQVDETPVKVLDPEVRGKAAQGYLWVMGQPASDVIFEFHPGRGKAQAVQMLNGFEGSLQRDGYGVYGSLVEDWKRAGKKLVPCGCWAHARRKFVDAVADDPRQAAWFVGEMRKLYLLEAHAREQGFNPAQRQALRQEQAAPILAAIKTQLDTLAPSLLPQSPLGKAVSYARTEWEPLQRYLENGRLEIDNNLTENAIRPTAVGKKNFLFIGHPAAGWRSAVIYSVVVSCQRRKIDVWEYLRDVFTRLPAATNQQLPDFVPARWQELRANR